MTSPFGLDDATVSCIHSILKNYREVEKAVIYGSRAKGNYREGSDIDLALFGNITTTTVADLLDAFEESLLPYTFDILAYDSLKKKALREHVDRVGKVLYCRDAAHRLHNAETPGL